MSLIKWEPFNQIDKFFEDFSNISMPKMSSDLAIDVFEENNKIIAEMNIPGIDPEKIKVSVENNCLKISGAHEEKKEDKEKYYYSKEIRKGSFERIVNLPNFINQDEIEAEYHNGVLKISIPKTETPKGKEVAIKIKK